MIQDIYPKKLWNQYSLNAEPKNEDLVLSFIDSKVLVYSKNNILSLPDVSMFNNNEDFTYLFSIDDLRFFLYKSSKQDTNNFEYIELRNLRERAAFSKDIMMALYTGKHLADWYRDNTFCGRCGHIMQHSKKERAMTCPICKYTSYPRIMPAVIVGVINNDKLLLTKYRTGYNHYALIAGFTEIGETVEETVSREVMEEAGIKVKNIKYYKSQPWGIANDILLGYFCEVDGDPTIQMDDNELKFAEWLKPDDIILQPDEFSLTNEMMKIFKENKLDLFN